MYLRWLFATVLEIVAWLGVIVLYFGSRFIPLKITSFKRTPILLIHGYLNEHCVWAYHARKLIGAKMGPIYMIDLKEPFRSIHDHVDVVARKVDEIKKETGCQKVILIGHSMGGIISALYALQVAPPGTVTEVITIASPLKGTYMANLGIGKCAYDMHIHSPLVDELAALMDTNHLIRFYHLATLNDLLVIPASSAWINGPLHQTYILSGIGHVGMLFSPRVAKQILRWLCP